jgi:hypothetical protein
MSYDFPDKQKIMKAWWEEFIEKTIKLKGQIYIVFKDLLVIGTIHRCKPLPLQQLLV